MRSLGAEFDLWTMQTVFGSCDAGSHRGPQCRFEMWLATSAAVRGRFSGWEPTDAVSDDSWAPDVHGVQGGAMECA
eukprot:2171563-Prymnesium_polylepis.1